MASTKILPTRCKHQSQHPCPIGMSPTTPLVPSSALPLQTEGEAKLCPIFTLNQVTLHLCFCHGMSCGLDSPFQ